MRLKEKLVAACVHFVTERLQNIEHTIATNKNALQSETKSSAGDKHETGRAMMQLEMEKAGQQLGNIVAMKKTLAKINPEKESQQSCLGSIIKTNRGGCFLSISAGKLSIDKQDYFAVSLASPIGKLLLGKNAGASFSFNGAIWNIIEVV